MLGALETQNTPLWYAAYVLPRREQSIVRQLDLRQIDSFLPTSESVHVWKNRQRVRVTQPVFPSYIFVRTNRQERLRVVQTPGVVNLVGNSHGPLPLRDSEIEFLRSEFCRGRIEPYNGIAIGEKVCIKFGLMAGIHGVLVKKKNSLRFVVNIEMINQNAAVEVNADDVERIS